VWTVWGAWSLALLVCLPSCSLLLGTYFEESLEESSLGENSLGESSLGEREREREESDRHQERESVAGQEAGKRVVGGQAREKEIFEGFGEK